MQPGVLPGASAPSTSGQVLRAAAQGGYNAITGPCGAYCMGVRGTMLCGSMPGSHTSLPGSSQSKLKLLGFHKKILTENTRRS